MTPQVSRFVRDVILADQHAADFSGTPEAANDRLRMLWQTRDHIIEAARRTANVADLPQWLLDLAERLGVERPA